MCTKFLPIEYHYPFNQHILRRKHYNKRLFAVAKYEKKLRLVHLKVFHYPALSWDIYNLLPALSISLHMTYLQHHQNNNHQWATAQHQQQTNTVIVCNVKLLIPAKEGGSYKYDGWCG